MVNNDIDIGKLISEETKKRLDIMGNPDYQFPKKATKKDAIAIVLSIVACVTLIIACMMGVIE